MICLTKQYCIELAEQKKYTEAIDNADKLARQKGANLIDKETLLDITNPIFAIIQKNC